MTSYLQYQNALRILRLGSQMPVPPDDVLGIADAKDYLHRAAQWARKTGYTDDASPFFDIALRTAANIRAPASDVAEVVQRLKGLMRPRLMIRVAEYALHWTYLMLRSPQLVVPYALPDPFEPILRCFERGNVFYTEHGGIVIGNGSLSFRDWLALTDGPTMR